MKIHLSAVVLIMVCKTSIWMVSAQNSITPDAIEITTQLTFIKVEEADTSKFETALSRLTTLAQESELPEDFDWLVYESDEKEYLIISFSNGLDDVLKLDDYQTAFQKRDEKVAFDAILNSLKTCHFIVTKNFLQEMLLPWSTVKEIATSKHPLTTMVEYKVYPNNRDKFDDYTRQLVKLLKETEYPYPLEGNRGAFGAYSSLFHIWFYDSGMNEGIYENIEKWMTKKGKSNEYESIGKSIAKVVISQKEYHLVYHPKMSY